MKQSVNLSTIQQSLSKFFARYHAILFFVLVAALLMAAILIILSIINISGRTDAAGVTPISSSFDEDTINKVKQLKASGEQDPLVLPNGRINPFSE